MALNLSVNVLAELTLNSELPVSSKFLLHLGQEFCPSGRIVPPHSGQTLCLTVGILSHLTESILPQFTRVVLLCLTVGVMSHLTVGILSHLTVGILPQFTRVVLLYRKVGVMSHLTVGVMSHLAVAVLPHLTVVVSPQPTKVVFLNLSVNVLALPDSGRFSSTDKSRFLQSFGKRFGPT